jgi:hypothetical protein
MIGYQVVTTDDEKLGKVVGEVGPYVVVEEGKIRKSKHALPRDSTTVADAEQIVRTSITRDVFLDSPTIQDSGIDEQAVREYYGLTPATAVEPTGTAEEDARSGDVETAPEERLRTRREMESGTSGLPGESPGLLTDRLAGIDEKDQEKR